MSHERLTATEVTKDAATLLSQRIKNQVGLIDNIETRLESLRDRLFGTRPQDEACDPSAEEQPIEVHIDINTRALGRIINIIQELEERI